MEYIEKKPIKGYENQYIAYSDGRIYSLRKKKFLRPAMNNAGYLQVVLVDGQGNSKGKKVHRLILETWMPSENKNLECNHKNMIKIDNRIGNLEWATHQYNIQQSYIINPDRGSGRKKGFKLPKATRKKMGLAKQKPITALNTATNKKTTYNSIQLASDILSIDRSQIYRSIRYKKPVQNYLFKFKRQLQTKGLGD